MIVETDNRFEGWRRYLVIGLALLAVGCSPIKVSLDYDPEAHFSRYATFDWLDNRPNLPDRVKVVAGLDSVVSECVREAVSREFVARGVQRDEFAPDFLVMYHMGENDDIDVETFGYRYSRGYVGWSGAIDVAEYREGVLVLDLIDAGTMELVWRATAQRTRLKTSTPDDVRTRVREAVRKMFGSYPPVP